MKGRGKGRKLVVTGKKKYPRYFKEHKTRALTIKKLLEDTDKKILDKIKE